MHSSVSSIPSQHFNLGLALLQRYGSTKQNETKSDIGVSMLHNVDTT